MSLKETERVLDEISREQLPQNLNLLPAIVAKIEQGSQPKMNSATKLRAASRLLTATLLLVVLLIIAFLSLPGVASAVRGLFGYIPGVGRVDQSAPLRVLAEPITDTRDGYTITVESAVLDSTRTVLNYRVSGQFPSWEDRMHMPTMCQNLPSLRLPDGRMLNDPSRVGSSDGSGASTWQDIYRSVPADMNSAVLVLPCLAELPAGEGPTNWEIPLAFAPAPPEMTVFPVIQPVTAEPAAQPTAMPAAEITPAETASAQQALPTAPSPDGWQWTLEGVATLDEGYYLETVLHWDNDPSFYHVEIYPDALHLFDANDQEVSIWLADQFTPMASAEAGSLPLNLQTMPITAPGPVRLVLDYVAVHSSPFVSFTLDVGSDPQPGQTWQVNKDVEIDGRTLRVVSAEYVQAGPNEPAMLMLYLESDSGILSAIAWDKDHQTSFAGGSPATAEVPFRSGLRYANGIPEGTLNIEFTSIAVRRDGPWTLTWTPPGSAAATEIPALPTEPGICQNVEPQRIAAADLPEGLGGRVAFNEFAATENLFVSDLDGSNRIPLDQGLIPQLSPDGQRIVYRVREGGGLYVRDLNRTESVLVTGPFQENVYDSWSKWSPDGQRIAFDRTTDHQSEIYVVNADSTNLGLLISEPGAPSVMGWAPDGQQIIYRAVTSDGERLSIRVFDIPSGQSREVVTLPLDGILSLSPDATRIVSVSDWGVFLQALDGSEPVLLRADADLFFGPVWSPDGQWILMAYLDGTNNATPAHVLFQPDTCQLLRFDAPLGNLVSSWAGK